MRWHSRGAAVETKEFGRCNGSVVSGQVMLSPSSKALESQSSPIALTMVHKVTLLVALPPAVKDSAS